MLAKDIKPGEVYAHQRSKDDPVQPIVFLAPVDSDHLYEGMPTGVPGAKLTKAEEATRPRPGSVYNSGAIGYPAAIAHPRDVEALAKVTLASYGGTTVGLNRQIEYRLITGLTHIIGPYEQIAAEQAERREQERQARQAEDEQREAHRRRIDEQKERLAVLGVSSVPVIVGSGLSVHTLSVDEMERLLSLIPEG